MESKLIESSLPDILAPLRAFAPRLQRRILEEAWRRLNLTPGMEEASEAENTPTIDDPSHVFSTDHAESEPPAHEPCLRIEKAKDDVTTLVKWLLQCSPREKLAGVVADALIGTDIEQGIKRAKCYDGDIGHDLRRDWEREVVRIMEAPDTQPADRAVAAWIMGAITTT